MWNGMFAAILGADKQKRYHPDPTDDYWYGAVGAHSLTGNIITPDSAMKVTAVYRCVALLAQTLATLPIHVYKKRSDGKGKDEAPQHPLSSLLRYQPNKWQTSAEWLQLLMTHCSLRGNCYSRIYEGPKGAVDQLVPLMPDRVYPIQLDSGRMSYRYTPKNGEQETLTQDEVMHIRGMSFDGITGVSPIDLAINAVALSMATEESGARLFKNDATPIGVVQTKRRLGPGGRKNFREAWNETFGGLQNRNKVAVLEDDLEFKNISMTSEQSQFIQTRVHQIGEIARLFGVPPHLIGAQETTSSWGTGIEQLTIAFVVYTLRPWIKAFEAAFARDLITYPEFYSAEFSIDGLLRGDSAARAAYYQSGIQNEWLAPDEVRAYENLNPRADGKGMEYKNPNTKSGEGKNSGDAPPQK